MTYQEILERIKPDLQDISTAFKTELMKIRSSRLSPALLEDIRVECFGQQFPLKHLGAISSHSPKELLIQLWDKSYVEPVVRAVEQEGLGLSLRIDGNNVYVVAPSLTEETRESLLRVLARKKEEAFQNLRHLRDKAWKEIQEGFQKGEIREDDKYRGKDRLDELVRECRDKLEELVETKRGEIRE